MRGNTAPCLSFRPCLQVLEAREAPSALALYLGGLTAPLTAAANGLNNQVSQLQATQTQLTADLSNPSFQLANDYSRAASLFGQIKATEGQIVSVSKADALFLTAAVSSGLLDMTDLSVVFFFTLPSLNQAVATAQNALSQATTIANIAEPPPAPSIATGANV